MTSQQREHLKQFQQHMTEAQCHLQALLEDASFREPQDYVVLAKVLKRITNALVAVMRWYNC